MQSVQRTVSNQIPCEITRNEKGFGEELLSKYLCGPFALSRARGRPPPRDSSRPGLFMTRVEIPEEEAGRNLRGGVGRLIFEEGRVSRPTYARGSHANSFPSARKKFAISFVFPPDGYFSHTWMENFLMEYFDEGNDERIVNETNTIKKDGFKLSSSNMCELFVESFVIFLYYWIFIYFCINA